MFTWISLFISQRIDNRHKSIISCNDKQNTYDLFVMCHPLVQPLQQVSSIKRHYRFAKLIDLNARTKYL